MKICFYGLSLMDYKGEEINDVIFLKKLVYQLKKFEAQSFYLYNKDGIGINDKDLYDYMEIEAQRLCIDNFYIKNEFLEYRNYSENEILEIIEYNLELNRLTNNTDNSIELKKKVLICLENLKEYDKLYNFNIFIFWGNSLYSNIIRAYCKKNNKKYYNLENGLFRPFTLMIDSQGVNYESSIPKNINFYKSIEVDYKKLNNFLNNPIKAYKDENNVDNLRKIYYKYLGIDIKRRESKKATKNEKRIEKSDYVYVPLQLETDSQIIKHSKNIKTMLQFVEIVKEAINQYNRNNKSAIKALIKVHPLYKSEATLGNYKKIQEICDNDTFISLLYDGNNEELIKNAKAVITINSTVGIEALSMYKPVITLGDSIYSIEGISYKCENPTILSKDLENVLKEKVNKEILEKYLYYLRFNYLYEIYKAYPDDESINELSKFIIKENKK